MLKGRSPYKENTGSSFNDSGKTYLFEHILRYRWTDIKKHDCKINTPHYRSEAMRPKDGNARISNYLLALVKYQQFALDSEKTLLAINPSSH